MGESKINKDWEDLKPFNKITAKTKISKEILDSDLSNGLSLREIGNKHGVSYEWVRKLIDSYEIERPKRKKISVSSKVYRKKTTIGSFELYKKQRPENEIKPKITISKKGMISLLDEFYYSIRINPKDNPRFNLLFSKKKHSMGLSIAKKDLRFSYNPGEGKIIYAKMFFDYNGLDLSKIAGTYIPVLEKTKNGRMWVVDLNRKLRIEI